MFPDVTESFFLFLCVWTGAALSAPQTEDFEAADDYGEEDTIPDEDVSSSKMPNFTSVPQHFRVRLGDSVRLPCEVDDLGDYTLLWKREEGDILTMDGRRQPHHHLQRLPKTTQGDPRSLRVPHM